MVSGKKIFLRLYTYVFVYLDRYFIHRKKPKTLQNINKLFIIDQKTTFKMVYTRDSNGAVLVYDITDEDSFQKVNFTSTLPVHDTGPFTIIGHAVRMTGLLLYKYTFSHIYIYHN